MKERPILFSAPMVRALLDGSKTQTRRVIKPQPYVDKMGNACWNGSNYGQDPQGTSLFKTLASPIPSSLTNRALCPFGAPGDRLWVRETWMPDAPHDGTWASTQFYGCKTSPLSDIPERFRKAKHCIHRASWDGPSMFGWKPSIHMPRWASRITLEITGVRVERLQDISQADAIAEGIERDAFTDDWSNYGQFVGAALTPKGSYRALWESINGPGSWDANPWVWAVSFKRLEQPA